MAEYIEKEPMIEEMQRLIDNVSRNYPKATETELIILKGKYEDFMEYIKEQPAADVQPVDRWISVKDKLPEVGKVVIICDKQGGVGAMELLSNGQWYHRGMAWSAEWILYWQPLPEPPEPIKG